jgi:hypothetical protein
MMSRSFGVDFFESLRHRIMLSANKDTLIISLLICIPFIIPSALLLRLGIPGLCCIEVGRVGTLVLFLILGEMVSVFLYCMMLAIGL